MSEVGFIARSMNKPKVSHSIISCLAVVGALCFTSGIPLACGGPCFRVSDLDFDPPDLKAYPDADPGAFAALLDSEMGVV